MRLTRFLAAFLCLVLATPALAQEPLPLLRVYLDTPYYYDVLAVPQTDPGTAMQTVKVYLEGKEVGESDVTYDCASRTFEETEIGEWTGGSKDFLPAALLAFGNLYC